MATGTEPATELTRLSPGELVNLAAELRDLGVVEFSWGGAHVKFMDKLAAVKLGPQTMAKRLEGEPKAVTVKDIYHDPRLWQGGKPPVFPGQSIPDEAVDE